MASSRKVKHLFSFAFSVIVHIFVAVSVCGG